MTIIIDMIKRSPPDRMIPMALLTLVLLHLSRTIKPLLWILPSSHGLSVIIVFLSSLMISLSYEARMVGKIMSLKNISDWVFTFGNMVIDEASPLLGVSLQPTRHSRAITITS